MAYELHPIGSIIPVVGYSVIFTDSPLCFNDKKECVIITNRGFTTLVALKQKRIKEAEEEFREKLEQFATLIDETGKTKGVSKLTYIHIKTNNKSCYLNIEDCILFSKARTYNLIHVGTYNSKEPESGVYKIAKNAFRSLLDFGFITLTPGQGIKELRLKYNSHDSELLDTVAFRPDRVSHISVFDFVTDPTLKAYVISIEQEWTAPPIVLITAKSYNLREKILFFKESGIEI